MAEPAVHAPGAEPTQRDAAAWMRSRSRIWGEWLAQVRSATAQRPGTLDVSQAQRHVERYRALARDLATARELLPTILWIAALLIASAAAGWWLIRTYPELISLVASQQMINDVEHGRLWTRDLLNVVPSSVLSVAILSNNITVTLSVFCSGIFLGLGVCYLVAMNGLMLGAAFAFTYQHGLARALLAFVLAHGPVELSVICIAGAAGIALGESLLRPTLPSRRESFELAARRMGRVLLAGALLLIGCGFIEGFVSPDPRVPMAVRVAIGLGYWCLMWLFLSGRLLAWTRRSTAPR